MWAWDRENQVHPGVRCPADLPWSDHSKSCLCVKYVYAYIVLHQQPAASPCLNLSFTIFFIKVALWCIAWLCSCEREGLGTFSTGRWCIRGHTRVRELVLGCWKAIHSEATLSENRIQVVKQIITRCHGQVQLKDSPCSQLHPHTVKTWHWN